MTKEKLIIIKKLKIFNSTELRKITNHPFLWIRSKI